MKLLKIQCPECREIAAMEEFSTSETGLRFRCGDCGQEIFVPNPDNIDNLDNLGKERQQATEAADSAGEIVCPKCGHAQTVDEACRLCGLNFLRFDPANLPPDPPEAAGLWEQLIERPDEMDLHERFVKACSDAERLDYATRQYRILGRRPGMAEVAERLKLRVLSLAQARIAPIGLDAGPRDDPGHRNRIFMWVMLLLALAGFIFLVYYSSEMLEKLY